MSVRVRSDENGECFNNSYFNSTYFFFFFTISKDCNNYSPVNYYIPILMYVHITGKPLEGNLSVRFLCHSKTKLKIWPFWSTVLALADLKLNNRAQLTFLLIFHACVFRAIVVDTLVSTIVINLRTVSFQLKSIQMLLRKTYSMHISHGCSSITIYCTCSTSKNLTYKIFFTLLSCGTIKKRFNWPSLISSWKCYQRYTATYFSRLASTPKVIRRL